MTRSKPAPTPPETTLFRTSRRGWLAVPLALAALFSQQADAQEIPRPSYARQKAKTALPTISNFRIGEVLLRVEAHTTTQFVDNVDASATPKADVILSPELDINGIWAVTKLNTLRFRTAIGYAYYVNSPNLNRTVMTVSPDSALSFDLYAGDVKINFHDQFSLQEETYNQGSLSGVAQLERFTNTAGVSILWDTNDVVWNLGYDRYNFVTLGGANTSSGTLATTISKLDHSTDQVSGSIAVKLSSSLIGGIEGTYAYSDYPEQTDSNFTGISAGPYFEFQLTKFTHVFLSGGYKKIYSGANAAGSVSVSSSTAAQPSQGDPAGYYANLSFVHRLNRFYSDRLEFSHTDEVEALSGHIQTNSVKYSGSWQVNRKMSLSTGLFLSDVHIVAGSAISGTVAADYVLGGASLGTGYQLTPHMDASLSYQYLKKMSERASESYTQNRITISIGYRF
jgi:hypothetical protein